MEALRSPTKPQCTLWCSVLMLAVTGRWRPVPIALPPTASAPQRVLRAAVGTFRPAGLLYGQIHARM